MTTTSTSVRITDVTKRITKKHPGRGARPSAAFIGDNAWTSCTGSMPRVPKFAEATFRKCLIDGKKLASWHPSKYERVRGGSIQIAPGALSTAGTSFATYFNNY